MATLFSAGRRRSRVDGTMGLRPSFRVPLWSNAGGSSCGTGDSRQPGGCGQDGALGGGGCHDRRQPGSQPGSLMSKPDPLFDAQRSFEQRGPLPPEANRKEQPRHDSDACKDRHLIENDFAKARRQDRLQLCCQPKPCRRLHRVTMIVRTPSLARLVQKNTPGLGQVAKGRSNTIQHPLSFRLT